MDNTDSIDDPAAEVTRLLDKLGNGDAEAMERLMPVVYNDLHRIAHRQMRGEHLGHTLQTTVLVHEAYLRLVDQKATRWQNRRHFYAIAARMMRRVLVDHGRARGYAKRGGGLQRVDMDKAMLVGEERAAEAVALDDALTSLAEFDDRKSRVVELRFFGGLSIAETAEVLEVSEGTVERDWTLAKAWLHRQLRKTADGAE